MQCYIFRTTIIKELRARHDILLTNKLKMKIQNKIGYMINQQMVLFPLVGTVED
jgi:hypothetical protein